MAASMPSWHSVPLDGVSGSPKLASQRIFEGDEHPASFSPESQLLEKKSIVRPRAWRSSGPRSPFPILPPLRQATSKPRVSFAAAVT